MEWETISGKPWFRNQQKGMTTLEYVVILVLVATLVAFTSPGISNALMRVLRK